MTTTTSDLTILDTPYLALASNNEIAEIMRENLGDVEMSLADLPRITTPSGGGLLWMIPRGGEQDAKKELIGVVLNHHAHRTYWEKKLGDGDNAPPDCSSDDGITGRARLDPDGIPLMWDDRGGVNACATCPFARFGSKGSTAIACARKREIVLLAQGEMFPFIVDLSATSNVIFESFVRDLSMRGGRLARTEISLKLEKVKSGAGIEYSRLAVKDVRALSPGEAAAAGEYGTAYRRVKSQEQIAA